MQSCFAVKLPKGFVNYKKPFRCPLEVSGWWLNFHFGLNCSFHASWMHRASHCSLHRPMKADSGKKYLWPKLPQFKLSGCMCVLSAAQSGLTSSAAHLEHADGRWAFNYKTQSQMKKRRPALNYPEKMSEFVLPHFALPRLHINSNTSLQTGTTYLRCEAQSQTS